MNLFNAMSAKNSPVAHRRLVQAIAALLLLILWGSVAAWIAWERHTTLEANDQVLEQMTTAVHEQTRNLFRQAETALVIARRWMADHPNEDPGRSTSFAELVDSLRQSSDRLIDVRLVTRDGILRYVPDREQAHSTYVGDRDYFKAQFDPKTRGLFIGQIVRSRVTGKLGIPISVPVERGGGGGVAVVFAAIELERIASAFESERLKPRGTINIIRLDGAYLFRAPMTEKILGNVVPQPDLWRYRLEKIGRGQFLAESSYVDGLQRIEAFSRVQDYPLGVTITASTEDVLGPWVRHAMLLLAVATALTVLTLLLTAFLLRAQHREDELRQMLDHLMLTDPLTEVGNRRMLMLRLEEEIQRAQRYHNPLTVAFIDLDFFKQVNDTYGHSMGDSVLVEVALSLKSSLRQSDHVARFGGEEFVLLLTETALDEAQLLVERIRRSFARLQIKGMPKTLTVSAGLAQWRHGENVEALLQRADSALYRAKEAGRDRTIADQSAAESTAASLRAAS